MGRPARPRHPRDLASRFAGRSPVANLLFGDAVFGGRLPFAWPRDVGQIPIYYAQNLTQDEDKQGQRYWNEPSPPLFPFGFGLPYSTFTYSNLPVDRATSKHGESVMVTVDVLNTGTVAADTVADWPRINSLTFCTRAWAVTGALPSATLSK